ncbi:MAG: hypothetical protein QM808_09830 [Steroidobacteraceae bacterium]
MYYRPYCALRPSPAGALIQTLLLVVIAAISMGHTALAAPIDEFRLNDIEQKIRDLETLTREQARLIAQLQTQTGVAVTSTTLPNPVTTNDQRWLNATNWNKVKPGMSELQVIEILGTPTQMRISDDKRTRTLLYGLEIGRSGFLTGKVTMVGGQTAGVEIPTLR